MDMARILIAMGLLLCAFSLMFLMMVGWKNRQKHFKDIDIAERNIRVPISKETKTYAGEYIVTTSAGDWLDRINVHGLGAKASSRLLLCEGMLCIERAGAGPLIIPHEKITEVRTASGAAGKFLGLCELLLIRHQLNEKIVDSYWKPRNDRAESVREAVLPYCQDCVTNIKVNGKDEIITKK